MPTLSGYNIDTIGADIVGIMAGQASEMRLCPVFFASPKPFAYIIRFHYMSQHVAFRVRRKGYIIEQKI